MKPLDFVKQFFACKCKMSNPNKGMVANHNSYDMHKEEAIKDFMVDMVKKLESLNLYDFFEFKFGNFRGAARCLSIMKDIHSNITRSIEVEFYKQDGFSKHTFKDKKKHFVYTTNRHYLKLYELTQVVDEIIKILLLLENTQNLRQWSYYLDDREREIEEKWRKELEEIEMYEKNLKNQK